MLPPLPNFPQKPKSVVSCHATPPFLPVPKYSCNLPGGGEGVVDADVVVDVDGRESMEKLFEQQSFVQDYTHHPARAVHVVSGTGAPLMEKLGQLFTCWVYER